MHDGEEARDRARGAIRAKDRIDNILNFRDEEKDFRDDISGAMRNISELLLELPLELFFFFWSSARTF